jgi:hypothetical protein
MSRIYHVIRTKTLPGSAWDYNYYPADKYTAAEAVSEAKSREPDRDVEYVRTERA